MDSTIAMRLAIEEYGSENIFAVSFDYGQRQAYELLCASKNTKKLGVCHKIMDIGFLNDISKGFCAITDKDVDMPKASDVVGNPQPITYIPNRNMILMSIASSYAEVIRASKVITGFQSQDSYGYHDTTKEFVDSINSSLCQNRTWKVEIIAPFVHLSKTQELKKLQEIDGNLDLLKNTITCYNPDYSDENNVKSCGKCPSCQERLTAFANIKSKDVIAYV